MNTSELRERLGLIVVTDPDCGGREVLNVVRLALQGGATAIQLRLKEGTAREMAELGRSLLLETRRAGALLFVNDRVDVAMAIGADGAHVGSDDLPLAAARRIVPERFLLGRSVDCADEVERAVREGADYLGAGPVFPTDSKLDVGPVMGLEGLAKVAREAGRAPVVGIGGISEANAAHVVAAGAAGIAVIGAVMRAAEPQRAAAELIRQVSDRPAGAGSPRKPTNLQ